MTRNSVAKSAGEGANLQLAGLATLIFALVAATPAARADDIVDLKGETVEITTANGFSDYVGKVIQNGTINLTTANQSGWTDGTYTIGAGATVNCAKEFGLDVDNRKYTLNIKDGGAFTNTAAAAFMIPLRYGTATLLLDNGTLASTQAYSANNRGPICIGYSWNNSDGAKGKVVDVKAILTNNSLLQVDTGKLQIGGARDANKNNKVSSVNIVFAVTNSTVDVKQGLIQIGANFNPGDWISKTSDSKTEVVFGQGADVTCNQIYVYKSQTASILFDGATLHWAGSDSSFIGQNASVSGDIYTIGEGGLAIDIPSGKALTTDGNSSALKGEGGITKIGAGSITWNDITSAGSKKHLFAGPLVVQEGSWTSSLGYAASAFRAEGGTLELSGALSAADIALSATDGGTLTLVGATITDQSPALTLAGGGTTDYFTRDGAVDAYTLDSLTLGEGAIVDLDATATAVDTITATETTITATTANPATINLNFSAVPSPDQTFQLFAADDAAKFTVNPKFGSLTLPHETAIVNGIVVLTITADDYTWNATGTNWGDTDAWTKGGASATWADGNNAIFNTAGAAAMLAADASPAKIEFSAGATVDGTATLAVPLVSVDQGITAAINAPTSGELEKTGAGTLELGASRTDATTLAEGTLKMASGATLDPAKLTLGTDAAKPVVFDYGGQTLTANPVDYLGAGMDVTLANGVFATSGEVAFTNDNIPARLVIADSATLGTTDRYIINTAGESTIHVVGGEFDLTTPSSSKNVWIMQKSSGRLNIYATEGATIKANGYVFAATGHGLDNLSPKVEWCMEDSQLEIKGNGLFLGNRGSQSMSRYPVQPECHFAMTNSSFYTEKGMILGQNPKENTSQKEGFYKAEFIGGTVTSQLFRVNADRPANAIFFNGTKVVSNGANTWFDTPGFDTAATPVTVGANGLVLDTNGKAMTIAANIGGAGAITKTGAGTLTISKSQTATGALSVDAGALALADSVSVARPVSIADGATLTLADAAQATIANLTLADGATINTTIATGVAPLAVETLSLPAGGDGVALTFKGGAFGKGIYPILAKTGATTADFASLVPNVATGADWQYVMKGSTLYLVVDTATTGFVWTDATGNGKLSDAGNWFGGVAPGAGDTLDFSGVAASCSIVADVDAVFKTVDLGDAKRQITIAGGTLKLETMTVGKNDCNLSVAEGAKLYIAGDATLTCENKTTVLYLVYENYGEVEVGGKVKSDKYAHAYPCYNCSSSATFSVNGLYSGATNGDHFKLNAYKGNAPTVKWIIGSAGLESDSTHVFWIDRGDGNNDRGEGATLQAAADFTIAADISARQILNFDTADGRKITVNGEIYNVPNGTSNDMQITGSGKVLCNYTLANSNKYNGAVTVKDTATLAINAEKVPTTGKTSVEAGAALEIAQSGTVELGGDLALADGATLKFNFTERKNPPVLNLTGKTVTFGDEKNVTVALSGERPRGKASAYVLTEGGNFSWQENEETVAAEVALASRPTWVGDFGVDADGNIFVKALANGLMLFVR